MNKRYYSFGNPFKVKFREHYCYKCGTKLSIVKHRKVVYQDSDEAQYYDFSIGVDGGVMHGPCEFIHSVFHCLKCSEYIEPVTQLNQEDIDIIIKSVQNYFYNKDREISIKKSFENASNEMNKKFDVETTINLCLVIEENGVESIIYRIPTARKNSWERPYYFKVNKKDIIRFIKNNSIV